MSQVFPVPAFFSRGIPIPNWIDGMIPGESAVVKQMFANKSVSRLMINELQSDAEFTAYWNDLSYFQVQDFLEFWKLVGTWDSFTLPLSFWHPKMNVRSRDTIIALSPTGLWSFKETPKFQDYNLEQQAITAVFRGTID